LIKNTMIKSLETNTDILRFHLPTTDEKERNQNKQTARSSAENRAAARIYTIW
jgi:hypothetical protein